MSYGENNRDKGMLKFQSIMHVTMGVFYLIAGSLILYVKYFGAMELPPALAYVLGSLMMVYGAFRFWRGITALRQRRQRP